MAKEPGAVTTDFGLLLLAAIWGVNFSVVKTVIAEIPPLGFNALRFPLAAAALGLMVWRDPRASLPHAEDLPRLFLLGLVGNVLYQLCFIIGIDWTFAGNASLFVSTTPVWTLIFSTIAGHERPTRWISVGIVCTLLGMALLVAGGEEELSLGSETVRGDLLMLLASSLWATYTVAGRAPLARYGPLRVTAWTIWMAMPFLVALGTPSLARTDLRAISTGAWIGVGYAGFFAIGIAYTLWYGGVHRLGNSRTAIYANLVPVVALVTAWLWLGEVPTAVQLVGAGVILGGLTLARLGQSPGPSSPAPVADPSLSRWRISGNS